MQRAFVTGGSGFVGGALIRVLVGRGVPVRALARSAASQAAVQAAEAEPVAGDLDDVAALERGMAGCDVAFHAAAIVTTSGRRDEMFRVNVEGTQRVLDAARAAGVRRVVHVSTEAVLVGGPPIVRADETWPLPPKPIGLYPTTKGQAEARVRAANGGGLEAVIVRPRFIWGRGDTTVLPKLVETVKNGSFKWIGGGRYLTSTCHVENVVEGLLCAAERGRPGETYFLTDGEPVEFRAFITALLETQGIRPSDGSVPRWVARAGAAVVEGLWSLLGRANPPLDRTSVRLIGEEVTVSDAKARAELGYTAAKSRDAGLAEMR